MKRKSFFTVSKNIILAISAFIILAGAGMFIWLGTIRVPDFKALSERKITQSTKIYDRTGEIPLYDIHENTKRTIIPFTDMGVNVKNATVAIEDSEFYQHKGIRIKSIFRAIFANVVKQESQGGSTITQQIIKNSLLTKEKTITRKLKEWILAIKIDQTMGKDEILAIYLNENPYGGNIYGIKEASKKFFNKEPLNLTLAESAYLAAIPKAPTYYSPYGKNKEKLDERKNVVLQRMKELSFINEEQYNEAKAEQVTFLPEEPIGIRAPHFVFYIKDYLEQKYGVDAVESSGLKVITTIDYTLQEKAEEIAKKNALKAEKDSNASNEAIVAIDPKTGQILAMVGSRDYFDKEIDGNFNVAIAKRQPGSSFKPFVYATAFNKGYTPDTILFDVPTEFNTSCNAYGKPNAGSKGADCYMPSNFNNVFHGPMKIRDALAQSINVPAVKMLFLTSIEDSLKTAKDMGIRSLTNRDQYGLTLVLGGGEVSLLDMVGAYGVFAAGGIRHEKTGILSVETYDGKILEKYEDKQQVVLQKNTTLQISNILSDNEARKPTFGANSTLHIPGYDVAVKTGTTNNNKDGWMIGYTPSIAIGVWSGNNDNTPMKKGSTVSGPTFNELMRHFLNSKPNEPFEEPDIDPDYNNLKPVLRGYWQGGEGYDIDTMSGKLATELTPKETRKTIVVTNVHDILYWVDRDNPRGERPLNPESVGQFRNWETAVQDWWNKNSSNYPVVTILNKPTDYDNIHIEANIPHGMFVTPNEGGTFNKGDNINISLTFQNVFPIKKVDFFLNDSFIGTSNTQPFHFSFTPEDNSDIEEFNQLKAVIYDDKYNSSESTVNFSINQ